MALELSRPIIRIIALIRLKAAWNGGLRHGGVKKCTEIGLQDGHPDRT